jgi:hypothetical protein
MTLVQRSAINGNKPAEGSHATGDISAINGIRLAALTTSELRSSFFFSPIPGTRPLLPQGSFNFLEIANSERRDHSPGDNPLLIPSATGI